MEIINKKLHPYMQTGIYGWIGEAEDDDDYLICPICGENLGRATTSIYPEDYDKCPKCNQGLDWSEIYEFEDTCYYEQLVEIKDQRIADLEAKLAEKEKIWSFECEQLNKQKLDTEHWLDEKVEEIKQLKQQLAESKKAIVNLTNTCDEWADKYIKLQQDKIELSDKVVAKIVELVDNDGGFDYKGWYKYRDTLIKEIKGE